MKTKIVKIARYTTKKDGSPLTTSEGKPYTSVRIQVPEYGDKWVSGFGNQANASWEAGSEVEIEVEQKGEYLNFTMPKKEVRVEGVGELKLSMTNLHRKIDSIINHLSGENRLDRTSDGSPMPNFDVPTDAELASFEQLGK